MDGSEERGSTLSGLKRSGWCVRLWEVVRNSPGIQDCNWNFLLPVMGEQIGKETASSDVVLSKLNLSDCWKYRHIRPEVKLNL